MKDRCKYTMKVIGVKLNTSCWLWTQTAASCKFCTAKAGGLIDCSDKL